MNTILSPILTGLNAALDAVLTILLCWSPFVPAWLSLALISAVLGVLLMLLYKHTSNQKAIARTRDQIKANMLALKLFKDELPVTFKTQARLFLGGIHLLFLSLPALAIMAPLVIVVLFHLAAYYQQRPLRPGETAVLTVGLTASATADLDRVHIADLPGARVIVGPVHIVSRNEVAWEIQAEQPGRHTINLNIAGQNVTKQLVIGQGPRKIAPYRPGQRWTSILEHPAEKPLGPADPARFIQLAYPANTGWATGADHWVVTFFILSVVVALAAKGFLKVRL